eukprot:6487461-Lingulodinium_polyedra.AAC.1
MPGYLQQCGVRHWRQANEYNTAPAGRMSARAKTAQRVGVTVTKRLPPTGRRRGIPQTSCAAG